MIVCTIQRFYLKIAGRCLSVWEPSLSPHWCVRGTTYIHSSRWMKRAAPFRKGRKKRALLFFFSRKLSPQEKQLFPARKSRFPSVLSKYGPVQHRSSIEQQATATPARQRTERPICLSETRSGVFPESFPSFFPGTPTKAESTYVLSNNWIDPHRVSARELLKFLALSRPSRVIIQPQAGRTVKSHESRRNTTMKLKRSKTPWLSWWHCNKIATCSLSIQGLEY